jgi:signal transduction histidine kinase
LDCNFREFTLEDVSLLSAIADQMGIIIESARLRKQVEETAILNERQRLARELHDSVTQSLYSLTLLSQGWGRKVEGVSDEVIKNWLNRIGEISHQSLKEMRLLLYELKPSTMEQVGLVRAIQHRLDAVEGRANIKTKLSVEGREIISPLKEQELYRIAQEALNNSLKHANASRVDIFLRFINGVIEMGIDDDGIGFDLNTAISNGGLGIQIMKERTEQLGGQLTIVSSREKGTKVKVIIRA